MSDPKEFIFVVAFTVVAGACWFVIAGIFDNYKMKHIREYLCGKRMQLIRRNIPDCQYMAEGSVNEQSVMVQYSPGNTYVRSLGYMAFSGKYEGAKLDDAITEYRTNDSDSPDKYYESLLFQYCIPADSPVYQLGYMNVRKVSKTRALLSKAVSSAKSKVVNMVGGSDNGETRHFAIGNTGFEAVIPACSAQDRWLTLLRQGLSERIEELCRMYSNASHIEIAYDYDRILLCVSVYLGYDKKIDEKNDYVIGHGELICATITEMKRLCYDFNL